MQWFPAACCVVFEESRLTSQESETGNSGRSAPRVLIVVPTLGQRIEYLREALSSIVEQPGCDLDLVIVAPPSAEVDQLASQFAARLVADPRRGISGAINAGIAAARSNDEFFGWLGDDDLLRADALATATEALLADQRVVMVYGRCDYIDDGGSTFFVSGAGQWARRILAWGPNLIPQPGSLMRLSAVKEVGGLDEGLRFAMDLDLFLKLRNHGRIIAMPRTLAAFRWHDDSLTVSQERSSMDESDAVRRRQLSSSLAGKTWFLWRWPMRWALSLAKRTARYRKAANLRR